ncbi:hypothetical protein [Pelagibius sp. Alg239-R121]|uniref:hypothetical protein n=1 Tax=Pelagibius sp. Alg239-R121 TaxID=2993448 RepID=UPI0024A7595C|nr:hypothetical protein [Pelagibius sp. Alg239-R121]
MPSQADVNDIGITILENDFDQVSLEWSFPEMVTQSFQEEAESRGGKVIDLSEIPEIKSRRGAWFQTGYSLNLGLSEHKISDETQKVLVKVMVDKQLDVILLLRPDNYNSGLSYNKKPPTGAFGLYKRVEIFASNPVHTFVQIEGRVIAGNPPTVIEDINGSNLSRKTPADKSLKVTSTDFQAAITRQTGSAVDEILGGLGL